MLSKSILKYIQSLHHKKFRDAHNVFIAEGPKVVNEFLSSGVFRCEMLCGLKSFFQENEAQLLPVALQNKLEISGAELQKLSLLYTPNKVVGIFHKKQEEDIVLSKRITLMLDDIRDPGNMGTIVRIADWFGVKSIVCSPECVEQYNPKVVQSCMGSLGRVNMVYRDLEKFINDNGRIEIYAATLDGRSLYSFNRTDEGVILIGSEATGINSRLLTLASHQITIPRIGAAESLNAAVATGIILSHFVGG